MIGIQYTDKSVSRPDQYVSHISESGRPSIGSEPFPCHSFEQANDLITVFVKEHGYHRSQFKAAAIEP